jgi:hypothetical protein
MENHHRHCTTPHVVYPLIATMLLLHLLTLAPCTLTPFNNYLYFILLFSYYYHFKCNYCKWLHGLPATGMGMGRVQVQKD